LIEFEKSAASSSDAFDTFVIAANTMPMPLLIIITIPHIAVVATNTAINNKNTPIEAMLCGIP